MRIKDSIVLLGQLHVVSLPKNTHREKAPSNKTPVLTRITNMDIWGVDASNELFIKDS